MEHCIALNATLRIRISNKDEEMKSIRTKLDRPMRMNSRINVQLIIVLLVALNALVFAQTTVDPAVTEGITETVATAGNETGIVVDAAPRFGATAANMERQMMRNDEVQSKLSTLWTVVTLDMIVADVLSLFIPEGMQEWEEFADGKEAEFMTGGAIMYQIPIGMVLMSKILPYKINRTANMVAAGLMTAAVIGGGSTDTHYIVCASVEVAYLSLIAWNAWKWEDSESDKKHNVSLNMNGNQGAYGLTYSVNF
jgi:hypothetical protein|tara:strand:- start:153 stop:911 length:759 start_codon:yes stop_codon:yes gene_type:complete